MAFSISVGELAALKALNPQFDETASVHRSERLDCVVSPANEVADQYLKALWR